MKMVMITMIGIPRSYVFMYVLMHKYSYKKEMNCEFGTNQEYMRILLMTMMMLMITFFSLAILLHYFHFINVYFLFDRSQLCSRKCPVSRLCHHLLQ